MKRPTVRVAVRPTPGETRSPGLGPPHRKAFMGERVSILVIINVSKSMSCICIRQSQHDHRYNKSPVDTGTTGVDFRIGSGQRDRQSQRDHRSPTTTPTADRVNMTIGTNEHKRRKVPLWPSVTATSQEEIRFLVQGKIANSVSVTIGNYQADSANVATRDNKQLAVSFSHSLGQGGSDINNLPESQEWEPIRASRLPQQEASAPNPFGWQEWGVPPPRDKLLLVITFPCNLNSTSDNNQPRQPNQFYSPAIQCGSIV
jgi:hypothetical protein